MLIKKSVRFLLMLLKVYGAAAAATDLGHLGYHVLEELPTNTFIGNVVHSANLEKKYGASNVRELRFSFLTHPPKDRNYFAIDANNGIIRTTGKIDRDKICAFRDRCYAKFDVAVRPIQYFQIIKIVAEIMDINDNAPRFPKERISHRILESTLAGASFAVPSAVDPDSPDYGIKKYRIEQVTAGELRFSLRQRRTADGDIDLRLVLRLTLDRERESHFQVKILAEDGGLPAKTGSLLIDVIVLDANDNDPKFENKTYEVHVNENLPIGSTIVRAQAHDPDEGLNGQIEYMFSKHTQEAHNHLFSIDSQSGEVVVKEALDYETNAMYLLSVTARDRGADSLPAHASVIIHLRDVNDNPPQIKINVISKDHEARIVENSKTGTFVAHISVIDLDSRLNGQFTCALDSPNFMLYKLYQTEYKIVTASSFDRERHSRYDVNIRCEDLGKPSLSSNKMLRVIIEDENDSRPRFTKNTYTKIIEENSKVNTVLLNVTANDDDVGLNAKLQYEILSEKSSHLFTINPDTGLIAVRGKLDHEENERIVFRVIAVDHGERPLTGSATVLVTVLDLDDEIPRFSKSSYNFGTYENLPVGTTVGIVSATDKDDSPFNVIKFTLDAAFQAVENFEIDRYSGVITTRTQLDREKQSSYRFIAVAASHENRDMSSTVSCTVYVADDNDCVPTFTFPSPNNSSLTVSNNERPGRIIANLRAVDRDSGENGRVSFHILNRNSDVFTVDEWTGALSTSAKISSLLEEKYELQLQVRDHGNPSLSSTATLTMKLVDSSSASDNGLAFLERGNLLIISIMGAAALFLTTITVVIVVILRRKDVAKRNRRQLNAHRSIKENEKMLLPQRSALAANNRAKPPPSNQYVIMTNLNNRETRPNLVPNGRAEPQLYKQRSTHSSSPERCKKGGLSVVPPPPPAPNATSALPPPPASLLKTFSQDNSHLQHSTFISSSSCMVNHGAIDNKANEKILANALQGKITSDVTLTNAANAYEHQDSASACSNSDSGRGPSGDEGENQNRMRLETDMDLVDGNMAANVSNKRVNGTKLISTPDHMHLRSASVASRNAAFRGYQRVPQDSPQRHVAGKRANCPKALAYRFRNRSPEHNLDAALEAIEGGLTESDEEEDSKNQTMGAKYMTLPAPSSKCHSNVLTTDV